ncbi:hypothetical protein [Priestia aryabhattai]|uniref:hypothetical protein n=1 Tax=Priestia aryabhattai TaxID=412384 RepID=UPI002E22971A|nr:hypothetical protein [Priestia aryabhattai]
MSEDKSKHFLYQMNINRRKFPEICEHLDEVRESENGMAWYLRELIRKDMEEKKRKKGS